MIYMLFQKGRERSLLMDIYTIWHHLTEHTRKYPWNCQPEFLSTSVPIRGNAKSILDDTTSTYVEPDISVICDPDKLDDQGCNGAPDWIIEIVSPASKRMDYYTKLFKYRTAGVREYWIIDAVKNQIFVYNFEKGDAEQYALQDSVKAGIYENLVIDFSKLDI